MKQNNSILSETHLFSIKTTIETQRRMNLGTCNLLKSNVKAGFTAHWIGSANGRTVPTGRTLLFYSAFTLHSPTVLHQEIHQAPPPCTCQRWLVSGSPRGMCHSQPEQLVLIAPRNDARWQHRRPFYRSTLFTARGRVLPFAVERHANRHG